ncbi:VacJ family lipoprotein [Novosphingobium sp. ZN18A2]|uniref:MlaA family lipoprotein n=1 Tax=Novosphingobium sp. ZN18A2 TaxID=3079861 RepID=UPI0030CE72A3
MLLPAAVLAVQSPAVAQSLPDALIAAAPVYAPATTIDLGGESGTPAPGQANATLGDAGEDAGSNDAGAAPITVVAHEPAPPGDPLMQANEESYHTVQAVDDAVVKPAAIAYKHVVPHVVRDGLHNVLQNLHEPVVFLNFLLQGKPGKAVETLGRFAINTTIGVAGLVDVAKRKPFHLRYRPNGFADTLGFYGVGPGPYLYLPLLGSTTVRDLAGLMADKMILPLSAGGTFRNPTYAVSTGVVKSLDERVRLDAKFKCIRATDHPYATERALYLAQRKAEIDALKHPSHRKRGRTGAGADTDGGTLVSSFVPGGDCASAGD